MTKPSNINLTRRYIGLLALVAVAPIFFISIPSTGHSIANQDKIFHTLFHFSVCLWFLFAREKGWFAFLIAFFYGVLIEIGQSFTVTRSFELLDIGANTFGACLALVIFKLFFTKMTNQSHP